MHVARGARAAASRLDAITIGEARVGARRARFGGNLSGRRCARERGAEGLAEQLALACRPFGDRGWRIAELADRVGGKVAGRTWLPDLGREASKELSTSVRPAEPCSSGSSACPMVTSIAIERTGEQVER
jgi:hypothetical protein